MSRPVKFVTPRRVHKAFRTQRGDSFMARNMREALAEMRKRGASRLECFYGPMDWRLVYEENCT